MRRFTSSLVLTLLLALPLLGIWQWQNIWDWWRLRGYTPISAITDLANATTMTSSARHLFYVNRPLIENRDNFNQDCPNNGGEQTIVLGCYHAHEQGIFLFEVDNAELAGIEQVTAAHEMLHAEYERLPAKKRDTVNALLNDYYTHDLHDQRILDTIAAYKQLEPNDLIDEMHSVFGTEVANLPPSLENYYKQYFTNRSAVSNFAAHYQQAFTSRRQAIQNYDAELATLKTQIDQTESSLNAKQQVINQDRARLDELMSSGQYQAYNDAVGPFNAQVRSYNASLASVRQMIAQYNQILDKRNAVALEAQTLNAALDSRLAPQNEQP